MAWDGALIELKSGFESAVKNLMQFLSPPVGLGTAPQPRMEPRMIFRLTQKLAAKLHENPSGAAAPSDNPYLDWHASLFRANRSQYIILMNSASLYSVVMQGSGITDARTFLDHAVTSMRYTMAEDGITNFELAIVPHLDSVTFSKTSSRSILGSLNELVYHAKYHLTEEGLSPCDTSCRLNEIPMGNLGYQNPKEAFLELGK